MKKIGLYLGVVALFSLADGLVSRAEAQAPTVSKAIRDCPDPCTQDINATPGITTVTYEILIENPDMMRAVVVDVTDDIPAGAIGFRVADKGNFQPCPGSSGPVCQNVLAPGGANGTGQVSIKSLSIGRKGSPFPAATIVVEVDFACGPLTDNQIVSNQARITTPNNPPLCSPSCNTNTATFTTNCLPPAPYSITKTVSPLNWKPGDNRTFSYTITIRNTSSTQPILGSSLQLTDFLPQTLFSGFPQLDPVTCPITVNSSPVMPLSTDNTDCNTSPDPQIHISGFQDIPPNGQVTLTFTGTVRDDLAVGSTVCNEAQVIRSGVPGLSSQACTTINDVPATVEFDTSTKTASADPVPSGGSLSYQISLTNSGTGTANNVVVTDTIPDCVDVSNFNASQDVVISGGGSASYNQSNRLLTINVGTMPSMSTRTIQINDLKAGNENPSCCNTAQVTSTEAPTPVPIGRTPGSGVPECFTIDPLPSPNFGQCTKQAMPPGPIPTGDPVTYTLLIRNSGQGAATNVSVRDTFSTCLNDGTFNQNTDVTVTGGPFTASYNNRNLTVDLGSMGASEQRTITITGLKAGAPTSTCCNTAVVVSTEIPSGQQTTQACFQIPDVPPMGCDLMRAVVTAKAAAPWVYTTVCTPSDSRLAGPPFRTNLPQSPNELDVEPLGAPGSTQLTLYDLGCSCADNLSLYKAGTMVHLKY